MMADEIDNYEIDLEFVRGKRKDVIVDLTAQGVPRDTEKLGMLLGALADMDRTTLAKRKIKVDVNAGNNDKMAMELIASMFNASGLKAIGRSNIANNVLPPTLGTDIPAPIPVDGEMAINPTIEDFEDFMSRTKQV